MTLSNADNTVIEHHSKDPFGKPRHGSLEANLPATLRGLLGGNDPLHCADSPTNTVGYYLGFKLGHNHLLSHP
ncbi:hypothetical protein [Pseudidiomarina donghaiensis]|uniref:Uncharacterized protein n=1 Tax=Pseudidiomarina donghaiensis TaxID=519452 RepID=A0A432XMT9_9GAMM|nr:hypothetical protein [Pseudidiomarina donghaiensis]RUO49983.1 hypothetical protein CWE24_05830 [Pseudidiomarina donghaiensis]